MCKSIDRCRRCWLAAVLLFIAAGWPSSAGAYNPLTHQNITENAWNFIKAVAAGRIQNVYFTQAQAQAAVDFYKNVRAAQCVHLDSDHCPAAELPITRLSEYRTDDHAASYEKIVDDYGTPYLACYLPADGSVFRPALNGPGPYIQLVNWNKKNSRTDYTGTVLGWYAGHTDHIYDTWVYPGEGSALRDLQEHGRARLALAQTMLCLFGHFEACVALAIGGEIALDEIAQVPYSTTSEISGHKLTSLSHFRRRYVDCDRAIAAPRFDDNDGYWGDCEPSPTFKGKVARYFGGVFDFKVQYSMSRPILQRYNIQTTYWPGYVQQQPLVFNDGPDGHSVTRYLEQNRTAEQYWEDNDILGNAIWMPVDNLGFANWNHWLNWRQGIRQNPALLANLVGLGGALHAIQDATVYQHNAGALSGYNHEGYEKHIEDFFDRPTMRRASCTAALPPEDAREIIMNWNDPAVLSDIKSILAEVVWPEIQSGWQQHPDLAIRQDLPVRELIKRLGEETANKHLSLASTGTMGPWNGDASGPAMTVHARWAIKYAVAGTVALLIHGAKDNVVPVKTISLNFEDDHDGDGVPNHLDRCPSLAGEPVNGEGCSKWGDAQKASFGLTRSAYMECYLGQIGPALDAYEQNQDHWSYLNSHFAAESHCEIAVLGETRGTEVERTSAKMAMFSAVQGFVAATGDRLTLEREISCVRAAHPMVYPETTQTTYDADLCSCTLDTDGDGVSNCDDECSNTPAGASVNPAGCARPIG